MNNVSDVKRDRIVLIAGVAPYWGIQSGPVIFRHLLRLSRTHEVVVAVFGGEAPPDYPFKIERLDRRSRLWPPQRRWLPGSTNLRRWLQAQQLGRRLRLTPDDRLLICLHTDEHFLARQLSVSFGCPIVGILHDMWPDSVQPGLVDTMRRCSGVLAVSAGLARRARAHGARNVARMHPIGETFVGTAQEPPAGELVLGVAGSMSADYVDVASRLADEVVALGATPEMCAGRKVRPLPRFATNRDALSFLAATCHALVVYQTFDTTQAYLEYSFPSRLIDFAQTGLPIVICAPPGSSLGEWAQDHAWPLWLSSGDDQQQIENIRSKLLDPADWAAQCAIVTELARTEFSPDRIHEMLENALAAV